MKLSALALAPVCLVAVAYPAMAQQTATPSSSDVIVVTAERTDRTLRETASSVVVITESDLADTPAIYSTDDVLSRIPNLVSTRPSSSAPAVRGIDGTGPTTGGNAFFGGTRPRLNFQIDSRTLTYNESIYADALLWDVQQVEVYRGPQSTLQGRNAIGGVVAVKTTDPSFEWSGQARGLIGKDDTAQLSGAVGGPIIDDILAFRVAADWRTEDAYVNFTPYTARRSGLSSELKNIENPSLTRSTMVRGKLLFTPSPDIRALVTLSRLDAKAPQSIEVLRPFEDHEPSFPMQPRFETRADVAIADIDFRVNNNVSLALLSTFADFRINRYAMLGAGSALINGTEYSVEPRLRFQTTGGDISGFLAGLLYRADQDEEIDLFEGLFDDHTDTNAVFGEVSWKPTARITLDLGARYEEEHRDRKGGAGPFMIDFDRTFRAFLPRATVSYGASDILTVGATVGRGYNAGGAGFSFEAPFPNYVYDKELVTNYELFARANLFDDQLDLRANAFFNDYEGLQLSVDINPDPALFAFEVRNLDDVTTYGLEMEARYRALDELTLFASAGLLNTRIDKAVDPTIEGNELERSPAFSLYSGFTARPVDAVDVSFDIRYTDTYFSDAFNNARGKVSPYFIANAELGWRLGPARVFVAASNLFDTTDAVRLSPGATYSDDVATITRPRRVTAGVEFGF